MAIAALLQLPIAWTWAYLHEPDGYYENSLYVDSPQSTNVPPDRLSIVNNHYTGVRWITVARNIPHPDLRPACRSNPGEPYDSNPVHPLAINDVFSGIADAAAWPQLPPGITPPGNIQFVQVEVQGLPFPCAYGRVIAPPGSTRLSMEGVYWFRFRDWKATPRRGDGLVLPLFPIWRGYILNTLVWGLPLFALTFIPPALRRSLRRRRGLCPACAYDLRATPAGSPCPECGEINDIRTSSRTPSVPTA